MAENKVLSLKESSNPTRPAIPKILAQQTNPPPKKTQIKVLKKKRNTKKTSPKTEYNSGYFHALASEKSSTSSDTVKDPGTASVTASCTSLHGTRPGDNASVDARPGVVKTTPPRKELPEGASNPSEAFLAMEDFEAIFCAQSQKLQEACEHLTRATENLK